MARRRMGGRTREKKRYRIIGMRKSYTWYVELGLNCIVDNVILCARVSVDSQKYSSILAIIKSNRVNET